MAVITMLSAKCSPGITTAVAALATVWPNRLLVVDADPTGGDLLPGWGGQWLVDGRLSTERGVVSFAAATRHLDSVPSEGLAGHVQVLPGHDHVRLLAGVTSRAQAGAMGDDGWRRLASATRDLAREGPDVLIDAGRWTPDTPWALIVEADLVLVGVRPSLRHISAELPLITTLRKLIPITRLGALVSATTSREADRVARAVGIPVGVELPDDPAAARFFSDGAGSHPSRRSALVRTSRKAALRLHRSLTPPTPPATTPVADGVLKAGAA
ncbi:hypothetical protein AB0L13_34965 [Saccharopolyspora shandongensis]|uniref:hypothetical protein n=1 Tax=Saccharopolyspora shandongensis TaxID=418495 RepID=UPI00343C662E